MFDEERFEIDTEGITLEQVVDWLKSDVSSSIWRAEHSSGRHEASCGLLALAEIERIVNEIRGNIT